MTVFTLNSSDLEDCKKRIGQVVRSINKKRLDLSSADSLKISPLLTHLNSLISIIAIGQINEILTTDLQQPRERIEKVTHKLDAAIKELQEVNKFVEILTNLTNLVSVILSPTSGLVKIAGIITQLDNFTIG